MCCSDEMDEWGNQDCATAQISMMTNMMNGEDFMISISMR